mgnify:FL=1
MLIEKQALTEIYPDDFLFHSILVLITFIYFISIIYRNRHYKKQINQLIRERKNLETDLLYVKPSLKKQQQIIRRMEIESKQTSQTYAYDIAHLKSIISGMHIYIAVLHNKNLSQLNSQDLHCFIKCYKEIDVTFAEWIEKYNAILTNREMTICILMRMGKEKQEIIAILQCSDGSYRTIKNRIKSKLTFLSSRYELEKSIKELH